MKQARLTMAMAILGVSFAISLLAQHSQPPSSAEIKREAQLQKKAAEAKQKWAKAEEKVKKLEQQLGKTKQEAEQARQQADKAQQDRDAVRGPGANQ